MLKVLCTTFLLYSALASGDWTFHASGSGVCEGGFQGSASKTVGPFPTKSQCNVVRNQVKNLSTYLGCRVTSLTVSSCTGFTAGASSGTLGDGEHGFGQTNFLGREQGNSFFNTHSSTRFQSWFNDAEKNIHKSMATRRKKWQRESKALAGRIKARQRKSNQKRKSKGGEEVDKKVSSPLSGEMVSESTAYYENFHLKRTQSQRKKVAVSGKPVASLKNEKDADPQKWIEKNFPGAFVPLKYEKRTTLLEKIDNFSTNTGNFVVDLITIEGRKKLKTKAKAWVVKKLSMQNLYSTYKHNCGAKKIIDNYVGKKLANGALDDLRKGIRGREGGGQKKLQKDADDFLKKTKDFIQKHIKATWKKLK